MQTKVIRRVLAVFHSPAIRQLIEDALRPWAFETVGCSSLQKACDLAPNKKFAVIFCEDRFQGSSYTDLLSSPCFQNVPTVVMIPADRPDPDFKQAIELGALDVLPVPCSKQDVQWMVIHATQRGVRTPRSDHSKSRVHEHDYAPLDSASNLGGGK
jgi:DNA-binding NtrC family response regulator